MAALCLPLSLVAQKRDSGIVNLGFYQEKAREDAGYEQTFRLEEAEDEIDFWADQKNYELGLLQTNMEAYQVYLNGKRAAYFEHQQDCNEQCGHGDYYFLKASYYFQNGSQLQEASLPKGEEAAISAGLTVVNNKLPQ